MSKTLVTRTIRFRDHVMDLHQLTGQQILGVVQTAVEQTNHELYIGWIDHDGLNFSAGPARTGILIVPEPTSDYFSLKGTYSSLVVVNRQLHRGGVRDAGFGMAQDALFRDPIQELEQAATATNVIANMIKQIIRNEDSLPPYTGTIPRTTQR
jgi:hypothetical protein